MASPEASFAERIGISQSTLWILQNNRRQTISRSYVLNIAKNLYCGSKVTLCLLACMVTPAVRAADLETFVTVKGDRFEKAHMTEVTPATVTMNLHRSISLISAAKRRRNRTGCRHRTVATVFIA
jgi:hypothetical protein